MPVVKARCPPAEFPVSTWHRLGDAGYLDKEGRLWCCGRVGHRIEMSSGPMFPLLCEPIFDTHPAVLSRALLLWATVVGATSLEVFGQYGADTLRDPSQAYDQQVRMAVAVLRGDLTFP